MSFSQAAWDRTADLRRAIHAHPFNRELAAGTLRRNRFQHYMLQDAIYLVAYSRTLAAASVRAPGVAAQEFFADASKTALVVERALHESYLTQFGISREEAAAAEPSPTCLGYTSFLLATAQAGSYEELVAAILPCFWIYWDVGTVIAKMSGAGNPYQPGIDTYADEGFGRAVAEAREATDEAARGLDEVRLANMHRAFRRCCQYEWMFWDAAYRLEGWPV
jgi:thiaminase (transcriptional activator TenA)